MPRGDTPAPPLASDLAAARRDGAASRSISRPGFRAARLRPGPAFCSAQCSSSLISLRSRSRIRRFTSDELRIHHHVERARAGIGTRISCFSRPGRAVIT